MATYPGDWIANEVPLICHLLTNSICRRSSQFRRGSERSLVVDTRPAETRGELVHMLLFGKSAGN